MKIKHEKYRYWSLLFMSSFPFFKFNSGLLSSSSSTSLLFGPIWLVAVKQNLFRFFCSNTALFTGLLNYVHCCSRTIRFTTMSIAAFQLIIICSEHIIHHIKQAVFVWLQCLFWGISFLRRHLKTLSIKFNRSVSEYTRICPASIALFNLWWNSTPFWCK